MMFDPAESIDLNGNTGPFIQYGYARIQSILRRESPGDFRVNKLVKINDHELSLLKELADFPKIIAEAGKLLSPSVVANYIYGLVKAYNSFYQSVPILGEEDREVKKFRILLTYKVGQVIKDGMFLLGIDVPNRM